MILGKLEETHVEKLKCSWGLVDWVFEGLMILRSWTNIESNQKRCSQKPQKKQYFFSCSLQSEDDESEAAGIGCE